MRYPSESQPRPGEVYLSPVDESVSQMRRPLLPCMDRAVASWAGPAYFSSGSRLL